MMQDIAKSLLAAACLCTFAARTAARAADPWADVVVSYAPGSNPAVGFTDPHVALGPPTRFTDPNSTFGGVVTPLNASFALGETVSLGAGGSLTLRFAEPVTNDPSNPFGIDLIVFGNAFFTGSFFNGPPDFSFNPNGLADGVFSDGGSVAVSADGVNFFDVAGEADGLFPTNGYADIRDPFTSTSGIVPADFTRPVNPLFNPIGMTFAQIMAGYGGSGGGLGVDIGPTGLSSVSYVRISNPVGATATPEIDAVADVASIPEPTSWPMFLMTALIMLGKFACRGNVKAGA
jgi:hypothetical protein